MNVRHAILAVLVLAVLTGPLVGCRSSRKKAPQQPVAMQPAPGTYGPTTTYVAPRPAPPTNMPSAGMPSTAVMPPPATWGSPDEPAAMSGPTGFPAATPPSTMMPAAPAAPAATSVILEERASRQVLDQQIVSIEERLRQAEQTLARRDAPPAAAAPAAPAATGGSDQQAARFAAVMKSKAPGEVEQNGSLVIIRFSDAFQPGSELLKKDARLKTGLLAAASELSGAPGARIQVVGHSDGTPLKKTKKRWGNNVNLSRERAQTVATELSKHGVPASRIGVDGRGSVEPLVFPENSDKDRARNRRVEIHVRF